MKTLFWICLSINAAIALGILYALITKYLNTTLQTGLVIFLLFELIAGVMGMRLKDAGHGTSSAILVSVPVLIAVIAVVLTYIALRGLSSRMF